MDNFVAIDVETANAEPTSVCSIGAVKVVDGYITDSLHRYVKPEPNYYFRHFTENIHGISREMTDNAPTFDEVWGEFEEFIGNLPLVAHNKRFDESCIKACFRTYRMDYPGYRFYCTCDTARRTIPKPMIGSYSLPNVCEFFGIPFYNHHDALSDAEACARIAMVLI